MIIVIMSLLISENTYKLFTIYNLIYKKKKDHLINKLCLAGRSGKYVGIFVYLTCLMYRCFNLNGKIKTFHPFLNIFGDFQNKIFVDCELKMR